MKKKSFGNINIGLSSLILIFIVLCLATLSLLTLSSAKSDLSSATKTAQAVKEYYKSADIGEEFIYYVATKIKDLDDKEEVASVFGDQYNQETECIEERIPMDNGLALYVALEPDFDKECKYVIRDFTVYIADDYEIDQVKRVWTLD